MRLLLSTYGSRGDVEPFAALAVRLRDLGAEVQVCAPPDFSDLLARVGVPLVPSHQPVRALSTSARTRTAPMTAEELATLAAGMIESQFETLLPAAEGCDALVSSGLFPFHAAARSVAEHLGLRWVPVHMQQGTIPSPYHPPLPRPGRPLPPDVTDNRRLWDHDIETMDVLFGGGFNAQRASVGLPPVANVRDHVGTENRWLITDPTLDPWQPIPDLDVVQTGAWILPDSRPLPDDLMAFLDGGTPPIHVGFGSIVMRAPDDLVRTAIEAARAQGRRLVLARGWAGLSLDDVPPDCFVVGEVNQQALFPRMAAVVHHGGAGTTTTAARAGVPQVVVPQIADQPYWAGRVAELGIGVAHAGPDATTESLSAAVETALRPEIQERASAVASTIRTDGTTVAARLLLNGT